MQSRVYIAEDTFMTLVSFLQKGLEKELCFLIIDAQDLIKERLWTFSSSAFIPNVKSGDSLIKKHRVPVIISHSNDCEYEGYSTIIFEPSTPFDNLCTVFVKTKEEACRTITNKKEYTAFIKVNGKWQEDKI